MGSAASSTAVRRHPAAASLSSSAATNSAREVTKSAAAARTEAVIVEGAASSLKRGPAAATQRTARSPEHAAAAGVTPPCGAPLAADRRAPGAAAGTYKKYFSFSNPGRLWQRSRKDSPLRRENPATTAPCPLSSCASFLNVSPPTNSSAHGGGCPAAAAADEPPRAFEAAASSHGAAGRKSSSPRFAFAIALLRQQRSLLHRSLVFLQLLHALLWWAAATLSLAWGGRAAAVLSFPSPFLPPCRRCRGTHAEVSRAREAGTAAAAVSHAAAVIADIEETIAVSTAAAAAAVRVTVTSAAAVDSTEASTAASGTAAEGGGKTYVSCSALHLGDGPQRSGEDDSSVTRGGRRDSSRSRKVLTRHPLSFHERIQKEAVLYVLDWRGRTFLGFAVAAALLSGLNVFLLCLWRNDWEAIDATIFSITNVHNHYAYALLLFTIIFCVYSTVLLLCACLCLLPRFLLSTSLSCGWSQSPSREHGIPFRRRVSSTKSDDARSCCSKAAGSSADPKVSPAFHRGCAWSCSSDKSVGSALQTARTTHKQASLIRSTSGADGTLLPRCQELEQPVSDYVWSCSNVSDGDSAAPASVEDESALTSSARFFADVETALSRSSSMVDETIRCCLSAAAHKESAAEKPHTCSDGASLSTATCPLHTAVAADALAPRASAPTTATTRGVLVHAGSAIEATALRRRSFSVRSAGFSASFDACSFYSPSAAQSPAPGGAAAVGPAVVARATGALPPSPRVALRPDANEGATALVDPADPQKSSIPGSGGEGDAARMPLLLPQRKAIVRVSPLHLVLLFAIIAVEANINIWTLYLGIELYQYVYFFIQFYAPFIYGWLLPILTLLLAAILLAPVYSSPTLLQVFASAAQPPYPAAYVPLLRPHSSSSPAAFFSSDTPVSAASSRTRCPAGALPPDHQESLDWCLQPLPSLQPAAADALKAPTRETPASAAAQRTDTTADPFGSPTVSSSLPLLPDSAAAAARDAALSARTAVFHVAAHSVLRSTPPSAENRAGFSTTSSAYLPCVAPALAHRAAADTTVDAATEMCDSESVVAQTPRRRISRSRRVSLWGDPQQQEQQQLHDETQEQECLPVATEDSQVQTKEEQHQVPYFFLKSVAQGKAREIMSLPLQSWCFLVLVLLWLLLLIVPFLPFFTSSPCLMRPYNQQKHLHHYPLPFRFRPAAPSDTNVDTAGREGSYRKKEKAATSSVRRAKKTGLERADQHDGTQATPETSVSPATTATATTSAAKASTAATVVSQYANVNAALHATGNTRRARAGVAFTPAAPSKDSEEVHANSGPTAARGALPGEAVLNRETGEAAEGPAGAAPGLISAGRYRLAADAWAVEPAEAQAPGADAATLPPTKEPTDTLSAVAAAKERRKTGEEEAEEERRVAAMEGAAKGQEYPVEERTEEMGAAAAGRTTAAWKTAAVATNAAAQPLSAGTAAATTKETGTRDASIAPSDEAAPQRELAAKAQLRRLSVLTTDSETAGMAVTPSGVATVAASGLAAPLELIKGLNREREGGILREERQASSKGNTQLARNAASVEDTNEAKEGPASAKRAGARARETAATGHRTTAAEGPARAKNAPAEEKIQASARHGSAAELGEKGGNEDCTAEATHQQCSPTSGCAAEGGNAAGAAAAGEDSVQRREETAGAGLAGENLLAAGRAVRASRDDEDTPNAKAGRDEPGGDGGGAEAGEACLVEGTDGKENGKMKLQCAVSDQETEPLPSNNGDCNEGDVNSSSATVVPELSFLQRLLPTPVWCAAADAATWVTHAWKEVQRDPFTLLPPKPLLIGHRGLPALRPENTEASFGAASDTCDALEADITISLDGVLLVIHDRTFRRTTNVATVFPEKADDPIHSFDWNSIQKLNAGKWWLDADPFGYRSNVDLATQSIIAAQKVPSFETLLRHLVKTQKKLVYDFHCPACKDSIWGCGNRCLQRVQELLRSTDSGNYIIWMQDGAEEVKREFAEATIVKKVFWGRFDPDEKNATEVPSEILNSDWRYTPAASVKKWIEASYWVNVYVVTTPWILSYFWCAGANSVTTDNCVSLRKQQAPVYIGTLYAFRFVALLFDAACLLVIIVCLLLRRYCANRDCISSFVAVVAEEEAGLDDRKS